MSDPRDLGMNKYKPKEKEWYCPKCKAQLPYFKSGKCKMCGNKMKWSK